MLFEDSLKSAVAEALHKLYGHTIAPSEVSINLTRKDFEGDLTVVVFNLAKAVRMNPDVLANELGAELVQSFDKVIAFNVVKGFLNLSFKNENWLSELNAFVTNNYPSKVANTNQKLVVEYSSPNTNKPLHLGHLRNNFLGYSVAEILKACGYSVAKVNLVNDRGIHICKSMYAWQQLGNGETPESSGMKGDHLVGKYYVEFDKLYKSQINALVEQGQSEEDAKKNAPAILAAQEMLRTWEAGDESIVSLWKMMNGWVYDGFEKTYQTMGVDFDKFYYESETYLLGKNIVQEGLAKGVFYQKEDGSVWVDLTSDGLDHKLLLRGDGTSVYLTQDLGTAQLRFNEYQFDKLIYVVGNEQDYHFKVLKLVMQKMGYDWWNNLHHLSYNMVDLPSGKMKSREGTVVDADDLMKEMMDEAEKITRELGKIEDFDSDEAANLYSAIGMGALKYYILKVDPEKRMLFNPAESIDFNGNTGPFIQYTYARIQSVVKKGNTIEELKGQTFDVATYSSMNDKEKMVVKSILDYPFALQTAADKYAPSTIANYVYELAKNYNQFYHENPIVDKSQLKTTAFRIYLSKVTGDIIKKSLLLLGIQVPERM
ncbi:MAG: Arginine--tRNA ligase [Bacteroidota bacterium]